MEWTSVIPWIFSAAMFVLAIITLVKNSKKDLRQDYEQESQKIETIKEALTKANLKLDQVCATTNETRTDIKAMTENMNKLDKRVTILEKTMETVWVRIDELKEAIKK